MTKPRILVSTIAALLTAASTYAADLTWDINSTDGTTITPGDGTWDTTAGNLVWNDAGVNKGWTVTTNRAVFGGADGTYNITIGTNVSTTGLLFNNSGYTLSASSAKTVTDLASAVTIAAGKTATIGSNVTLTRNGGWVLAGGGRLVITGTMNNTGTTASDIREGTTLEVAAGGSLTYNASPVIGANAAVANADGTLLITGGTVTTNGTSNFVLGNSMSTTSTAIVTISAGALNIAATSNDGIRIGSNTPNTAGRTVTGTFNLDGGVVTTPGVRRYTPTNGSVINATFNFNGGTLTANRANPTSSDTGSLLFFDAGITANVKAGGARIDSGAFNITVASPLLDGGGGGGLEKLGAATLTLPGNNTYTGNTTVTGGTLLLTGSNTSSSASIASGATLQIGNGGATGTFGSGAIVNNGTLTVNRTGTYNLSNGISGTGAVTLLGGAAYTLGGVNTYTGATTVTAASRVDFTGTFASNISLASGVNFGGEGSTTGSLTFGGTHTLFFDPATPAHFTANAINASAATITLNPTNGTGGTNIVVLEAAAGITGVVNTNFLFTGRGTAHFNAGNTQLLFDSTPGTLKWTGSNSSDWDTTTQNWLNGATADVFFNGDAVTFDDSALTYVVTLPATVSPGSVTFNNTTSYTIASSAFGGGSTIAGSGTMTKNNTGTVIVTNDNTYTGGTTINAGIIQLGDGVTGAGSLGTGTITNKAALMTNFGGVTGTIANNISGSGTLEQIGSGTTSLTGTNSYTGQTTVTVGTLQIGNGGTSGTLGSGTVVNNATLAFNRSDAVTVTNAISGTGGVTKLGAGTLTLGNANTYSGLTTITGGAILVTANTGVLGDTSAGTIVSGTGGALQLQGGVTVAGEALTLIGEGVNASTAPGSLRNISGNNEWAGNISIDPADTAISLHRISSETGNLKISGTVTLGPNTGDQFVLQGNGSGEISGVISGPMRLTRSVTGTGVWTLSGANTYTGKTAVSGGTLRVSSLNSVVGGTASSSLGAPTSVANGTLDFGAAGTTGTLQYTGTGETTDRVLNFSFTGAGGGVVDQSGTGLLKFTSNTTTTGTSGAKTLTLQGSTAGTGEIAGNVTDGGNGSTVGLTKAGTGTWTLSGAANTYTGPTNINAGTLALGTSGSLSGSISINIAAGATFDVSAVPGGFTLGTQTLTGGTGATAGLVTGTLNAGTGSTISPGAALRGTLAFSNGLSVSSGAHLAFDLAGSTAGTGYDQLVVNGGNITLAGDLTGSTLTFTPGSTDVFYLILNNGLGTTTGTLGGVPEGGSLTIGAQQFQISYTSDFGGAGFAAGTGNDVALMAVPEPGSAAALLAGLGLVLGRRRRRA